MSTLSELIGVGVNTEVAEKLATNNTNCGNRKALLEAHGADENIVIFAPITLDRNLTITTQLTILKGGSITTNGYTLTINGPFSAGAYQCFVTSGSQVVFGPNATPYLLAEWFGALGDGSTDDTAAWQLAINRARLPTVGGVVANLPIQMMHGKVYMINSLSLASYFVVIRGSPIRKAGSAFKCNTASATMFVMDANSNFITFDGVYFDGNSLATNVATLTTSGHVRFVNCQFAGGVTNNVVLDDTAWITFENCEMVGTYTYGIKLTGDANVTLIRDCHLSGTISQNCIYTDSNWNGDNLIVEDTSIEAANATNLVFFDHASSGGAPTSTGNKVSLIRCRFDRTVTNAHVKVGRYCWGVNIEDCRMVDPCVCNIETDANYTTIRDCHLGNATAYCIKLTSNSARCHVLNNIYAAAGGGLPYQDAGASTNYIFRKTLKNVSGSRPSDMQPCEFGAMYLDTTLDADGYPIFWQGTKWIKSDGSDA